MKAILLIIVITMFLFVFDSNPTKENFCANDNNTKKINTNCKISICKAGFQLLNNNCVACPNNNKFASSWKKNKCNITKCKKNYKLENNICI